MSTFLKVSKYRRIPGLIGLVLMIASVIYLVLNLRNYFTQTNTEVFSSFGVSQYAACVGLFVACMLLGGLVWVSIMKTLGSPASLTVLWRAFLLSVVAKHLPGNVGHFLGRAALIRNVDPSIKRISLSFFLESGLLAAVGLLIAFSGNPQFVMHSLQNLLQQHSQLLPYLLVAISLILISFLVYFFLKRFPEIPWRILPTMTCSFFVLAIGFALLGLATNILLSNDTFGYLEATSLISLSFVAGFLVPGAPGGLGVREAVFVLLLPTPLKAQGAATIIILRCTQIVAEILILGIGFLIPKPKSLAD